MPEENQNTTNDPKNDPIFPSLSPETKKEKKWYGKQIEKTKIYIDKVLQIWRNYKIKKKDIQLAAIVVNIIAVVAFIWIGYCQHTDTLKSIALADSSLKLSKQSLDIAQRNFQIENRPYLGVKEISIIDTISWLNIRPRFMVIFENYGKIPATDVRITSQAYAFSITAYKIENFGFDTTDTKYSSVLPPGEKASIDVVYPFVMNEINIANIFNKRFFVYVYGLITYSDVFGGKDSTSFSYIMNIDSVTHIGTFSSSPFNNWMK